MGLSRPWNCTLKGLSPPSFCAIMQLWGWAPYGLRIKAIVGLGPYGVVQQWGWVLF